jgi:ATP-binding cassette, subfamily B, bacterial
LPQLGEALIAWREVRPLFQARPNGPHAAPPEEVAQAGGSEAASASLPMLEAHELEYGYRERAKPLLNRASLSLWTGDHVILEGPSGSGKSTLASLLAGLRQPAAGTILLRGLDQHTLGLEAWRRQIVVAPQFHENHVLSAPLAFNLLMARDWPPCAADLAHAEDICKELGLGALLQPLHLNLISVRKHILWPTERRRRVCRHQLPDNQKIIKHPDRRQFLFDRRLRAGHLLDIGRNMKRPDTV